VISDNIHNLIHTWRTQCGDRLVQIYYQETGQKGNKPLGLIGEFGRKKQTYLSEQPWFSPSILPNTKEGKKL
jgi:hypothetical protein